MQKEIERFAVKFHIIGPLRTEPWGGGNQFLSCLRKYARKRGAYSDVPSEADAFLFNSHHAITSVLRMKAMYPSKLFVHRVDGPMNYRGVSGTRLDRRIACLNISIADGTVFQSKWSREQNIASEPFSFANSVVIKNAPDPDLFYPSDNFGAVQSGEKIRLISGSWSTNPLKGFSLYHQLDEQLDTGRFEYSFAGNVDYPFKNITHVGVLSSAQLGEILRKQHIFVFASKKEACSNSVLEALHCGLPVASINSSSNPELINGGGLLFEENHVYGAIEQLANNLEFYRSQIIVDDINEVLDSYLRYFEFLGDLADRPSILERGFSLLNVFKRMVKG